MAGQVSRGPGGALVASQSRGCPGPGKLLAQTLDAPWLPAVRRAYCSSAGHCIVSPCAMARLSSSSASWPAGV